MKGRKVRVTASLFAMAVRVLRDQPSSAAQVAAATGLSIDVTRELINEMRNQKIVRVHSYIRGHKIHTRMRLYQLSSAPDVPPPAPLTQSQRHARYRARLRAEAGIMGPVKPITAEELHGGWNAGQAATIPETASN